MSSFRGSVALVTGGGTGAGRAAALAFAREEARVCVVGTREGPLQETVQAIRRRGGEAISVVADVTVESDVERAVQGALKALGRLDVAFNNAGTEGEFGALADLTEATWNRTFAVNAKGVWLSMKHEIKAIIASGGKGAIVNNSTDLTEVGIPGTAIYTASKAAVDALTRVGASDYGPKGIRVNAVNPGNIEGTPMTSRLWDAQSVQRFKDANPLRKIATAEDVAEAAVWLCSSKAGHINGQTLNIDGGLTLQ